MAASSKRKIADFRKIVLKVGIEVRDFLNRETNSGEMATDNWPAFRRHLDDKFISA
jgi:hypothetical protein